jgi:ubiquitin-protein ligase
VLLENIYKMQKTATGETVIVPRNFKLLEELERSEKGLGEMAISYGLVDPGDTFMTEWNGGILAYDGRFFELRITCTDSYPASPPRVRFVSRINMTCVDQTNGEVIQSKVSVLKNWNRNSSIEQVLLALRAELYSEVNRRLRQPPDGTTF